MIYVECMVEMRLRGVDFFIGDAIGIIRNPAGHYYVYSILKEAQEIDMQLGVSMGELEHMFNPLDLLVALLSM